MTLRAGALTGLMNQPSAQVIDGSLKFDNSKTTNLSRTPGSEGNRKTWTWSGWFNRQNIGANDNIFKVAGSSSKATQFTIMIHNGNYVSIDYGGAFYLKTNRLLRDTSGWYNFVVTVDTTLGTADNRIRLYINGVEETSFATRNNPNQDEDLGVNRTSAHTISTGDSSGFDGLLSNFYLIDGQALGPENFGFTDPLTNTWRPKKYTGTFTATIPGKSERETYADSGRFTSYATFGTVTENDTGYTLPSGSWSHYGGKVKELDTGGFQIVTVNSATTDFFMGCWVKFESYATGKQIGINLSGTYVYLETRSSGVIGIRQDGISRADSSATSLNDGNWHHIALSRTGGTLYGFVDGTAAVSASVSSLGNSVGSNSQFWFFGGSGTSYNIDGQIIDPVVYIGEGKTSYTTPSSPLIDSSGNVNELFGINNSSYLYYASPGIDLGLSAGTALNSFYLPFDGNSPIGQDKSGNGNDFTPVNFGGSVELDSPIVSGARPTLNTTQGGTQAAVGVFGSKENKYYTVTTANGSVYQFDITSGDNPSLEFIRGATYRFDYSSYSLHPVLFSSSNPDSSTTAYTTGTSIASNVISFTVPHDAPDTLYYYCSNHPTGMNGAISITTDNTKADQYASNVTLALPLVGANSDVSASIACTMTNKSVTSNGNAAASSVQSNFYNGSFYFDGTGDFLNLASSTDFGLVEQDWTVECYAYITGTNGTGRLWYLEGSSSSNIDGVYFSDTNMSMGTTGSWSVGDGTGGDYSQDKWIHVAVCHDSTNLRMYIDGVQALTTTNNFHNSSSKKLTLMSTNNGSYSGLGIGYIQDFRIYKGIAKYTSNFVPAATNPDILPDTPSGVSGGSKLTKITDGAVTFDGTGDYLSTTSSNSDLGLGIVDYTIECYVYMTAASSAEDGIFQISATSGGLAATQTNTLTLQTNSGVYRSYANDTSTAFSTAVITDQWVHLALVRKNESLNLFVNGVKDATTISDYRNYSGGYIAIGGYYSTSYLWDGFISNFRVVNGTALYTSNFTPPSAPLTNVTYTKLLCCQSNISAITAAVSPVTITANGNAAASNFNPFNTNINTVRGQETGYATLNPLNMHNSNNSFSNGNLEFTTSGSDGGLQESTLAMSSGKFYFEAVYSRSGTGQLAGIRKPGARNYNDSYIYVGTGNKYTDGGSGTGYGDTLAHGDIIGTAFDATNGTLEFFKNGVSQGQAFSGISGTYSFFVGSFGTAPTGVVNFGQKPFKFSPPDGFQPLNAANIRPETVVPRSDQFVGVTTYTGNGGTKNVSTNHSPDLVWIKQRAGTGNHALIDSVRGRASGLASDLTNAETTSSADRDLVSFDLNGFTLGAQQQLNINDTGEHIAWTWKAGGNKNTFNVDDVGYASASDVGMNVGGQNDNAYNKSQTWSSNVSGGSGAYGAAANAFNGNLSNFASPEYSSAMTYTNPSASDTVIDTFEIYGRQYSTSITLELNDTDIKSQLSTTVTWHTITGFKGQNFSKLYWRPTSGNQEVRIYAIKINGKILVDTSVTPPDAPSIANTGASVGTKQGFSILKYTGSGSDGTIAHGLSQAPDFFFGRDLEDSGGSRDWIIYHKSIGGTGRLKFTTGSTSTSSAFFQNTAPSNSLITVGTSNDINSTNDYILYCWHNVAGLQKFGSYTGNANADGPFIELGFRPSVIIIKRSDGGTENWTLWDAARNPHNVMGKQLYPNLSSAEADAGTNSAYGILDFVSNGVKIRGSHTSFNSSGHTFIYAAWAEAPTFNLYGGQSNAR